MKNSNKIEPHRRDGGIVATKVESFSGPIPHPDILKQYDDIVDGAANRIILMAEKEQQHRIDMEHEAMQTSFAIAKIGQWLGFVLLIILILVATVISLKGNSVIGGIIFGTTILGIAIIFVLRKVPTNLSQK